jgi:hypothetical protein
MATAVAAASGLDAQVALRQVEETLASFARLGLVEGADPVGPSC